MKKIIFCLCAFGVVLLPSLVFAAPNIWPTGFWGPLVSCTGNPYIFGANGATSTNSSACTSLCDLVNTVENIIYFGISVVVFIITPILFAWGGLMFMFSRGKPEGISKARSILTGALIGLCIVLCAWLIVNTVVNVLGINNYIGGFGTGTCNNSNTGNVEYVNPNNSMYSYPGVQ
jgi:hypothetical protein